MLLAAGLALEDPHARVLDGRQQRLLRHLALDDVAALLIAVVLLAALLVALLDAVHDGLGALRLVELGAVLRLVAVRVAGLDLLGHLALGAVEVVVVVLLLFLILVHVGLLLDELVDGLAALLGLGLAVGRLALLHGRLLFFLFFVLLLRDLVLRDVLVLRQVAVQLLVARRHGGGSCRQAVPWFVLARPSLLQFPPLGPVDLRLLLSW